MRRAKRFFHDAATMAGRRLRRGGIWSLRLRFLVALLRLLPLPLPLLLLLSVFPPNLVHSKHHLESERDLLGQRSPSILTITDSTPD